MGRKPNPLISLYFERGAKLNDNSNRYPHTCKQCGEYFPKGRIDNLTAHITKRCPAISDSDRMRACLELHGISNARAMANRPGSNSVNGHGNAQLGQQGQKDLPQGWSALETLAEASRQVDLNENNRVPKENPVGESQPNHNLDPSHSAEFAAGRFELEEQFTLDNPPTAYDARAKKGSTDHGFSHLFESSPTFALPDAAQSTEMTPEERLQTLLPVGASSPEASNLSVAAAATARLNPPFLDPQLQEQEPDSTAAATAAAAASAATSAPTTTPTSPSTLISTTSAPENLPLPPTSLSESLDQPWGEMTYLTTPPTASMLNEISIAPMPMHRGGTRMDTSDALVNGRPKNSRARFTPARRKEVQQIRKIGACIRCRILRKNCGKGDPCDTCRKVLSPRVWRTGCVRTRLQEQLDLYSAGVQVVLSQNRINLLKDQLQPINNGTTIQVSHFSPETGIGITVPTLVAALQSSDGQEANRENGEPHHQVIMIDQEMEDLPDHIEKYMRIALPLFIEHESSRFMRITLQTAQGVLDMEEDELLRKAIELWGLVEIIDRERHWIFLEKPGAEGEEPRYIKEIQSDNDADTYTMICMQLNAAAERKANNTSKGLLSFMDRLLQDSKNRVGFKMFLTALIFLNCVEKSTWAFKAWEQAHLRPGWPLERDPSAFTQQGSILAGLLRMLLGIRKALPPTARSSDGKLVTTSEEPQIARYFETLDLDHDTVASRQTDSQFSALDSRSLELTFCSHLLLPNIN
ncbi:uncharacterized protein J7T54_003273 [Emericellopsis cladophorae]|uniref:Zn(II)2Cys6 transcription factor (Eurofung) n=1 Tax=Emericellopsis cladophorae TaxID=2686198 RepID=A0A9P9Y089_9HYPO|nr:uncharacterized protein J7T54_003273 [Emericellopsis cladophorae]KAI6781106.1 hypothetical protein J7T54_003273 [Emericellopsis cladophorae]